MLELCRHMKVNEIKNICWKMLMPIYLYELPILLYMYVPLFPRIPIQKIGIDTHILVNLQTIFKYTRTYIYIYTVMDQLIRWPQKNTMYITSVGQITYLIAFVFFFLHLVIVYYMEKVGFKRNVCTFSKVMKYK